ncbi:DegT/DnrJ/EryC1/StrS family aminotransferase [Nitrosopumilus sp.]|nr:DegT/DnrJ/EryC1/StrS family aminotransferase [Nitrosopumilus sp.]
MIKRSSLILTAGPSITEKEISYVNDAVSHGWNDQWNKYIIKFEETFAKYIGIKHAIATSSCTGAMHLALQRMGIGPGDEVIIPDITWVATASVVTYVGAKPIFVDIEPDTWCIDPISIKKSITPKTKAIMPVHLYGHPANMNEIQDISKENDLLILEDAAPSLGAEYNGNKTGSFGHASAFSFQGAKIATSGEGGIFLTNDSVLYENVSKLGDHGRSLTKALWNDEIGYKYKMSNIQAALGLAQLERIDELVDKKRKIFQWYSERLGSISGIQLNVEKTNCKNIYWMTTIVLDKSFNISRDDFIQKLKEWNIDSRPAFYPLSHMPMFETVHNPNAEHLSQNGINLPSGHNLTEDDVDYICNVIKNLFGSH